MCTKFYLCSNGVLYTLTCPTGLLFDSIIKKCATASNVLCTDGISTSTTAIESTTLPTTTTTISTTTLISTTITTSGTII